MSRWETAMPAIAACTAGVDVGNLGLLGARPSRRTACAPMELDPAASRSRNATSLRARLDNRLGIAVLASRFLPGSRLPMYLALGISSQRPWAFAAWSFVAVLLWTPALVSG